MSKDIETIEEVLENLSAYIATNTIQGYQERRKYDDKKVEQALQSIQKIIEPLFDGLLDGTGAKLTEIGWERFEENKQETLTNALYGKGEDKR